jgi:putative membrane protein
MFLIYKSMHLVSMVAWFAGLFYMFRLFVYHVENKEKSDVVRVLKIMERKLYYYITFPAMVATIIFGILLLSNSTHNLRMLWFSIKSILLLLLIFYHFYIGYTLNRFKKNDYFLTSKQCRLFNEIPTIFLIGIIFVAVFRASIKF